MIKFTHQYIGESYGDQPFLFHENSFDEIKSSLKEVGMDVEDFYIGNTELFSEIEVDLDELGKVTTNMEGLTAASAKLKFDSDGIYTYKSTEKFIVYFDKYNDVVGAKPVIENA